ncbi:MAG: hypothetical protein ACOCQR_01090 [bacterium]
MESSQIEKQLNLTSKNILENENLRELEDIEIKHKAIENLKERSVLN